MSDEQEILGILIDRDIRAFVAGDWALTAADFDEAGFTGYSGAEGSVRLEYATLEAYRDSWLAQSVALAAGRDAARVTAQLHAVQRIDRIEIDGARALAVKVFDGELEGPDGRPQVLSWTTYYFLRFDHEKQRWLITGFLGYLPSEWKAA